MALCDLCEIEHKVEESAVLLQNPDVAIDMKCHRLHLFLSLGR